MLYNPNEKLGGKGMAKVPRLKGGTLARGNNRSDEILPHYPTQKRS
jgi:hypothetical protein